MLWFVFLIMCGQIVGGDKDARHQQIDEIVRRHRDFAVSRLNDPDDELANAALDALATLDFDAYLEPLREKLKRPVSDTGDPHNILLAHFVGRAAPSDLRRVREIVAESATKGEAERKDEPYGANSAIVEFEALEVLLGSKNAEAVQFATKYLEAMVARNPGPGIAQMNFALDLVGRFQIKSAVPSVKLIKRKVLEEDVLSALALNGDLSAIDILKKRVQATPDGTEAMRQLLRIVEPNLVEKLALTNDQLDAVYENGDRNVQLWSAAQLARKGHAEKLRTMARAILAQPDGDMSFNLAFAIGQNGNESFLPDLEALFQRSKSDFSKLCVSKEIFKVVVRAQKQKKQPE